MSTESSKTINTEPKFGHSIFGKLVSLRKSERKDEKTGILINSIRGTISMGHSEVKIMFNDKKGPLPDLQLWADYLLTDVFFFSSRNSEDVTFMGDITKQ